MPQGFGAPQGQPVGPVHVGGGHEVRPRRHRGGRRGLAPGQLGAHLRRPTRGEWLLGGTWRRGEGRPARPHDGIAAVRGSWRVCLAR